MNSLPETKKVTLGELPCLDFARQLPKWVSLRLGLDDQGRVYLLFWSQEHDLVTELRVTDSLPTDWMTAVNSLGGSIFEKEHPGEAIPLMRRVAEAAGKDHQPLPGDVALHQRLVELTCFGAHLSSGARLN